MDLQAFKQRILPVQGRLFRLAQLFLRNREEAEDALQDVLLRLWTNRQQLDAYHSVEALAVQMTKNLCLDKLKAHNKRKMSDDAELLGVQSDGVSPYQQVEFADSADLIRNLIDTMPDQQKLILHLRDVEEYSFEEIEQITGLSVNNIRVILSRARQRLRDNYVKANDYEAGH
ncbi:RNA polymerase sigma factor [Spirosoma validum]|uniref:Sigma-70 family RNA polymerase sigma factor n=1 Tax=Spirosoma validum TaxID=2771355 RepID=A0A927B1Q1_9BACT|nr:sigma-70 family RNA polymerase sigma factor [Spirosoma validum]MBD2753627.1 sigma-70 family RNA polymerase sigma factor [Spirosoma validum]